MKPNDDSLRTLAVITTTCFPDPRVRAIRWTQLARVLPSFGWRVVLLSRYYGSAASRDEIDETMHPSVEIEYVDRPADAQPEPGRREGPPSKVTPVRRLLSNFATLWYTPDPSARAWNRMKPRILEAIAHHRPDAVLAGFPSGGNVALVPWLRRAQSAPVIADFEDPFGIDYRFRPRGIARVRERAFLAVERAVHEHASLVLHAIPIYHRWARLEFPSAREHFRQLMMSVPETMVEGRVEPIPDPEGLPAVRVVGSMGGPEMLLLAKAVAHFSERAGPVRLDLVGTAPETSDEIRALLGDRVRIHGRVQHREALGLIAGASLLVNILNEHRRQMLGLSSKLFEFVASGNPVIEVNPTRSDRFFVQQLPGVRTLIEPTVEQLSAAMSAALSEHDQRLSDTMREAVRGETWPERGRQLAGWLDDLVEGRTVRP